MKRLRSLLGAGRRTFKATPQEVAALHRILDGDDPRYRKLVEQLETAPSVTRDHPSPDALVVNPSSTFDDLLFPLEVTEIASDWVRIRDARSGRDLKFRARVVRSGFLKDLEGITADGGPWPADWEPADSEPADPLPGSSRAVPALRLPDLEAVQRAHATARAELEAFVGAPIPSSITVYPAATTAALHLCEGELGVRFPATYRRFLEIADGADSRVLRILGHRDLYRIDDPAFDGIVIAWDRDHADDTVVVVSGDGSDETVRRLDVHGKPRRMRDVAADMQAYLRARFDDHP